MTSLVAVPNPERKPRRYETRARRRRRTMIARMGRANSPTEQLAVAYDYFRSTITDHAVPIGAINQAASHATEQLLNQAEQLNPLPKAAQ